MDPPSENIEDEEDFEAFRIPANGKISIAILKIPQPMVLIGNPLTSPKSCNCSENENCPLCSNSMNDHNLNNHSSLIKVDKINIDNQPHQPSDQSYDHSPILEKTPHKTKKSIKFLSKSPKKKRKPKSIKLTGVKSKTKSTEMAITMNPEKRVRLSRGLRVTKKLKVNRITTNIKTKRLNKPGRKPIKNNSKIRNLTTTKLKTTKCSKKSSTKGTDKSVDTKDIENALTTFLKTNDFNILDHLNEAETLLKEERERRFDEIRHEYSLLRDIIEEKFHLVIGTCNKRLNNLSSTFLGV